MLYPLIPKIPVFICVKEFERSENPCDKSADMGCIGDTAGFAAGAAVDLEKEPEADGEEGGHADGEDEEKPDADAAAREENDVATKDAGNGAGGAEAWDELVLPEEGSAEYVREAGEYAAKEVEEQVAQVAEGIFKVVAEDPEIKHVAEEVKEAAVHEHAAKEGKEYGYVGLREAGVYEDLLGNGIGYELRAGDDVVARQDLGRHGGVAEGKGRVVAPVLQEDEHEDVGKDQEVVDPGGTLAVAVIITDRKEHS